MGRNPEFEMFLQQFKFRVSFLCVIKLYNFAAFMLHGSAIGVGSHPYPYAHLILTTVCPCVVWDKIEFYRLFLCLLDRAVEGACF